MNLANSRSRVRVLLWGAVPWLIIAALVLVQIWPNLLHTATGWLLFFAIATLLYVFARAAAGLLFPCRDGIAISQRSLSLGRILVALPAVLVVFALSWRLSRRLGKA